MFQCPTCGKPLVRTPADGGVFWRCAACGGQAAGLSLLRTLLSPAYINQLWLAARAGKGVGGYQCPACGRPMKEVSASSEPNAPKLDVCAGCQFVWFDAGEYEQLPTVPRAHRADEDLPQEVRELLAREKVERIAEEARRLSTPDAWWKLLPAYFGLAVKHDTGLLEPRAWVTWFLAAVTVAVSVLAFFDLERVVGAYGFIPAEAWQLGGITLLTSFFLHGGIFHLVSNMYFLLVFGGSVEERIGKWRYGLLLAFAAVAGNLLHMASDPRAYVPLIGASGGISGVIVFYGLRFRRQKLFFCPPIFALFRWISLPAWLALIFWILVQGVGSYFQLSGFGRVSSLAHLGGAAVGFLFWLRWRKL
jgi:membrane associated rhomboid family serine protease